MNKYQFDATNLIAETFERRGVQFDVVNHHGREQLLAGFSIKCGPNVIVRFINCSECNDVAVRIFGLITNVTAEKKARVMEACCLLNRKVRYIKFYPDTEGVNVDYDFPLNSPDERIGEMAFEIFVRMMKILNDEYIIFMKALYTDEELDIQGHNVPATFMQRLRELRSTMKSRMASGGETSEDEDDDDDDFDFDI